MALNHLLQGFLPRAKIIDHEAKTSIQVIVLPQFFVHRVGPLPESDDFHLTWSDITSELLDLVVKHVLELLQLLRFLLQVQDAPFSECNLVVLIVNILKILKCLSMLFLGFLLLVVKLLLLVLDLSVNQFNFSG